MQEKLSDIPGDVKLDDGPDPVDIHVGARLKLRRNLLGMSQEQMGKALGLTFQQIQKYERAANRMGASRLHQIAQLLNVPVAWFFDDMPATLQPQPGFSDNKQAALEDAPHAALDSAIMQQRETYDLIRAYYCITDIKQRRKILELIKSMADDKE